MAFLLAGGVTIAIGASMSVIELRWEPGKEHGLSLSAHKRPTEGRARWRVFCHARVTSTGRSPSPRRSSQ